MFGFQIQPLNIHLKEKVKAVSYFCYMLECDKQKINTYLVTQKKSFGMAIISPSPDRSRILFYISFCLKGETLGLWQGVSNPDPSRCFNCGVLTTSLNIE